MDKILVTGGAGFIGSHVVKKLYRQGYYPIIIDNLSLGHEKAVTCGTLIKGDIACPETLHRIFTTFSIRAVMHFAAHIDVGASAIDPGSYYQNNVCATLNLLNQMRQHGVNHFIFSSSAAIFGLPQKNTPLHEDHPKMPINPYGTTKLMVEQILQDYAKAYHLKYINLRYFNAAGGDPEREVKNYKTQETNLIPKILRSLKLPNHEIKIFGTDYPTPDGTCIRDYIHVEDLAEAHILGLNALLNGVSPRSYNLGNGSGFSVKDVIAAAESVTGHKVNFIEAERRAGDPPLLLADSSKARKELGWSPQFSNLKTIILHAWQSI